jgi:acyl-CoA thioesterase
MTVKPHMVNGHGIAHGGFIFLLADSTFAFACNSHNERAVAAQCNISFIRPGKLGDRAGGDGAGDLAHRRSGIYDVRVTVDGVAIAECAAIPAPSAARGCRRNVKSKTS